MPKIIRVVLLLSVLGMTGGCRQAVKLVVHAQSGAALTQGKYGKREVVVEKPQPTTASKAPVTGCAKRG